jgi:IS5 family transposase
METTLPIHFMHRSFSLSDRRVEEGLRDLALFRLFADLDS